MPCLATGIRGEYFAPITDAPVITVDIPSGIDGLTGEVMGLPMHSNRTITFQALKPGHLIPPGSNYVGDIEIIDIGLDTSHIETFLIQRSDITTWLPKKLTTEHKWKSACWMVVALQEWIRGPILSSRSRSAQGQVTSE